MLKSLVILLRPQQWLKNLFVLAPAFFAGSFLVADVLRDSLLTFIIFSAAASTVYIFNDWIDRQADSKHPEKRTRPIASGQISGKIALITGLLTLLMSMLIGLSFLNFEVIAITGSYLVLNLAYTLILKTSRYWMYHVLPPGLFSDFLQEARQPGLSFLRGSSH